MLKDRHNGEMHSVRARAYCMSVYVSEAPLEGKGRATSQMM